MIALLHLWTPRLSAGDLVMTPLTKKLLQGLGLLIAGAVALNFAARILVSAIPLLATLLMFVLIFGLLFGFFRSSK